MIRKVHDYFKRYRIAFSTGWFLAIRAIRHSSKWTTGLIVFIMVLTFLNLVVVSGLLSGLIVGSFQQFRESYAGEVIVTSAAKKDFVENSQSLYSFLEHHPKVSAFSARYGVSGQVLGTLNDLPEKDERANKIGIRVVGVDFVKEEPVTHFSRFLMSGELLNQEEEGYALIGANMLKKYSTFADANIPGLDFLADVDVGSKIRLTLTSGDSVVSKEFIIKGIVKSKVDEISTRLFIPAKELRRLLTVNQEQYQEFAIKTDPLYASTLVAEIKDFMVGHDARIQTSLEAIPSFLRDMEVTFAILGNSLSSIALVVAAITIFIVIFINAITKRKFIGIMKGIGISPLVIELSYIFQAIIYGIVGSAIGLLLTFGLMKPYFDTNPIDFPFSDGILVATPDGAAIRVAILLFVTLVAGYIPAKIIVRRNTLDAILGR
jgi:ABC-type lipoprotein release transport system permease subunit